MSGQKKSENFQIWDKLTDIFDGGPRNLLNYLHPGQIVLLVIFAISLLGSLLIGMFTLRKFIKDRNVQAPSRLTELCWNTTQLGLIFTFIVLCDTGKIGWITQNAYSWPRFVTLIGIFLLLGLLTVRKNTKPDLLDVNITTEIKGWMQVSILVYHYINAYNVLPIFIVIRLFVTMYVTLSAYGHFCYFWKKNYLQGDEMLKHSICKRAWICLKQIIYRYIQVLFRMNFLVILLCVVFRKTYMKYYFVPLITTAYTLSAATMTVWVLLLFFLESSCSQHLKTMNVSASNSSVRGQVKAVRNFVELYRKDICFLVVLSAATLYSHLLHKSAYLFSLTFFKR
uniref:CAS1 domain-containing protein 1 n=2 Tax=Schistocephalus solidus TaxID=70667 RepID=A0A0X3NMN0_SCHSO